MMGRARASGEAQAMAVAVFFFKNLVYFDILCVFMETKKVRTANTNKTVLLVRRDLFFSRTQW